MLSKINVDITRLEILFVKGIRKVYEQRINYLGELLQYGEDLREQFLAENDWERY